MSWPPSYRSLILNSEWNLEAHMIGPANSAAMTFSASKVLIHKPVWIDGIACEYYEWWTCLERFGFSSPPPLLLLGARFAFANWNWTQYFPFIIVIQYSWSMKALSVQWGLYFFFMYCIGVLLVRLLRMPLWNVRRTSNLSCMHCHGNNHLQAQVNRLEPTQVLRTYLHSPGDFCSNFWLKPGNKPLSTIHGKSSAMNTLFRQCEWQVRSVICQYFTRKIHLIKSTATIIIVGIFTVLNWTHVQRLNVLKFISQADLIW